MHEDMKGVLHSFENCFIKVNTYYIKVPCNVTKHDVKLLTTETNGGKLVKIAATLTKT